jgi:hypothetical protein
LIQCSRVYINNINILLSFFSNNAPDTPICVNKIFTRM